MLIVHIISGLGIGGAELMLRRLIQYSATRGSVSHVVISLGDLGAVGLDLRESGIEVHSLKMRPLYKFPFAFFRLVILIKKIRPDITQTWMYHADLIGGLAARLAGCRKVVWGIRNTSIPQNKFSMTSLLILVSAIFSKFIPIKIICCAESARQMHITLGYDSGKMCVIPNGYDLTLFVPLAGALRHIERKRIGVGIGETVIGVVGRFDPLKDFLNFIHAAKLIALKRESITFLMVGRNLDGNNLELMGWLKDSGIQDRFILLGERSDVPRLMGLMDIFCLPSLSEGFPNVLAEAMAAGIPCVTTNVGDAKLIAASLALVVPPQNPSELARAITKLINLPLNQLLELGEKSRLSIQNNYSLERIISSYESFWQQLQREKI